MGRMTDENDKLRNLQKLQAENDGLKRKIIEISASKLELYTQSMGRDYQDVAIVSYQQMIHMQFSRLTESLVCLLDTVKDSKSQDKDQAFEATKEELQSIRDDLIPPKKSSHSLNPVESAENRIKIIVEILQTNLKQLENNGSMNQTPEKTKICQMIAGLTQVLNSGSYPHQQPLTPEEPTDLNATFEVNKISTGPRLNQVPEDNIQYIVINQKDHQIDNLKTQIETLEKMLAESQKEILRINAEDKLRQKSVDVMIAAAKNTIENELEEKNREIQKLKGQLKAQPFYDVKEVESLKEKNSQLEKERIRLVGKMQNFIKVENELQRLEDHNNMLINDLMKRDEMNAKLMLATVEVEAIRENSQKLSSENADLISKNKELVRKIKILTEESKSLNKTISEKFKISETPNDTKNPFFNEKKKPIDEKDQNFWIKDLKRQIREKDEKIAELKEAVVLQSNFLNQRRSRNTSRISKSSLSIEPRE